MAHPISNRSTSSVEVPAFEADGNLLALLPKEALDRLGAFSKKHKDQHLGVDIKIVIVGENRDFAVLATQIKSAFLLHSTSSDQSGQPEFPSVEHLIACIAASRVDAGHSIKPNGSAMTALIARFSRAISRAAMIAGDELIHKALERPTDIGAIVELLRSTVPLLSAEQEIDPRLGGSVASLDAEEELLERASGLKDAKWVGDYLSINPKSVAAKARRNELLAIQRGDRNLYPTFQFKDGKVIPGIREILEVLPLTNGWSRLSFLLNPDPGLDDRSPIQAFTNDRETTLALARNADIQGAA